MRLLITKKKKNINEVLGNDEPQATMEIPIPAVDDKGELASMDDIDAGPEVKQSLMAQTEELQNALEDALRDFRTQVSKIDDPVKIQSLIGMIQSSTPE